ncbi:hypothetical protein [Catenovulum sediminis]|uniref:TMhelix containing protein n=1 Tax=Catenovulum sediminis TaxID=1740262 RepID=A0ABV1REM7_9ALTE|nr:hypothetical protein [Catenovulum sediminis]
MMLKKFISVAVTLVLSVFVSAAYANNTNNLYQCVDKQTLQQDAACIANLIDNNSKLQTEIAAINQDAAQLDNGLSLAVMTMNRDNLHIEIVAVEEPMKADASDKL